MAIHQFGFLLQSTLYFLGLFLVLPVVAHAQTEPPQFVTVDGRLYDSTNPTAPLLDPNVSLRIQVLNPAKTCILYEEQQSVSTLASGYFNARVGSPTTGMDSLKRTALDSGNSMSLVFQNQNAPITGLTSGGLGCSYTPSPGESRYFRFIVTPSTTGVASTLSPDMTIDSVPQSLVAETLQGRSSDDFLQISANVTQAKAESLFGGSYASLTSLLSGTSSLYLQNTANGTVIPSRPSDPAAPSAGQIWYDSVTNELKYYDGSAVQSLSSSSADPTKLPLAGGTMAGAINMGSNDITSVGHITQSAQRTFRFGGYTGGQETTLLGTLIPGQEGTTWYNTTTDKLMYFDGTASQELLTSTSANSLVPNCNADESLQMSAGPIYVWSCVNTTDSTKLALAGGAMTGALTMNAQNQVRYADADSSNFAAIQAPTTISSDYTLTLPVDDGTPGQVLQTDGNGLLSWLTIPSAPVSTVFGRSGAVVAVAGDYDANQVDNTPAGNIAATDVQAALNELDTEKAINTRNIGTAANSGLAGGGDLSADRNLTVDITGTTALGAAADNADEVLIYDASGSVLRKVTRAQLNLSESEVDAFVANNGFAADADKVNRAGDTMTGSLNLDNEQELRLSEADGSGANYVALKSPTTLGANYTLTFPVDDGNSGQYLQTDGNGVLSWVTPAGVGETNTASNVTGSTGVGIFKQKSTFDLQFKSLLPGSNKLSISGGADDVTLDVVETNLNLGNIPNTPAGSIAATNAQAAINELDTEKVGSTRAINTNANSGLAGGGDLSADRNITVDITGTTAETTVAGVDEILIWDASASALRKMTRTNFVLSEAEVDAMISNNGFLTSEADTLATVTGRGASTATNITMNTQAQVRYADAAGGEYAAIQAPATLGANYVLTLPVNDGGVGEVLSTDGNGVLSWIAIPSAPVSTVFGRSGAVVAVAGDYDANQVDNTPAGNIAATDVQAALNELDTEKAITTRNIGTAANSGLAGGGDLSADRNLTVDITGTTALGAAADNADEVLIYDASGSVLRKVTRSQLNLSETEVDAFVANNGYAADADKVNRVGDTMTGSLNIDNEQELRLSEADGNGANYVAFKSPSALGANYTLTFPINDGNNGQYLQTDGNGVLSWVTPAGVGETNTGSNVGTAGVGVFKQKNVFDLEFKNINAASNKVVITDDAANDEIDINVDEANFNLGAIPNTAAGTIAATNAQAAINELDTEKVATTRAINTAATSGLSGGGDLSADRSLAVNINGTTAETVVAGTDELLIYDASAGALRKMTRTNFVLSESEVDAMVANNGFLSAEADTLATVTGRGATTTANIVMSTQAQIRYADAAGGEYAAIQAPATVTANYVLTLPVDDGAANQVLTTDGNGILTWTSPASAGEVNTASNQGVAGVGVYDAKAGVDLQFRNINAASNKVSVVLDGPNKEIDIDVNEANFALGSIPNTAAGNIAATDAQAAINELDTEKVAKAGDTMTGTLAMDNQQAIRFIENGSTNFIAIRGPAATTGNADFTLTLPPDDGNSGQYLQTDGNGALSWVTPSGVGETNTASNQGAGGVGVFIQKTSFDLEFKNINAGSNKVTITNDAANDEIDINVDEANFNLASIPNTPAGTIAATNAQAAINELDTEKVATARAINTAATSGLTGGGDLSADRSISVNINGTTAETAVAGADEILIYDASAAALRKMTRTNFVLSEAEVDAMVGNNGYISAEADTLATVTGRGASTATDITLLTEGEVRFGDTTGGEYAAIKAPADLAANYTLTLPADDGTPGQVLSTNGSGVLSWIAAGSSISADSLNFTDLADALVLDASTDISVTGTNVLSITNSGTANSFVVNDEAGDASPFIINNAGLVGIGGAPVGTNGLTVVGSNAIINGINIGRSAGGTSNTLIGENALGSNNAAGNTAVGRNSLASNTAGQYNTSVGFNAMESNQGSDNVAIGAGAIGGLGSSGSGNVALGNNTLGGITTGSHNTGLGRLAGSNITSGSENIILGYNVMAPSATASLQLNIGDLIYGDMTPATRAVDLNGSLNIRPFGTATGQTGQMSLRELAANGTNTATIRSPDTLGANYVLTLPVDDGTAGQVLSTDGNGVLSWIAAGSSISADSLNFTDLADALVLDASTDISATGTNVFSITKTGTGDAFVVNTAVHTFRIENNGHVSAGSANFGPVTMENMTAYSLSTNNGWNGSGYVVVDVGVGGANPIMNWIRNSATQMILDSNGQLGIGTATPGTRLDVAGAITSRPFGTNTGETGQMIMRELAANGTNTATIRAPDALGANYVLTLPVDDGTSGQVLSTDGNGVLSWIAPAASISADSLNFTDLADALVLDASTDISVTGANVLSVTNSGTGNSFRVNDEAGDASPFVINAGGDIGVGTTSPAAGLHIAKNGAASAPGQLLNGSWFSGGTSTTTKPYFHIEPSGTTSTSWSTSGTAFGINAAGSFGGDMVNIKHNNTTVFSVATFGGLYALGDATFNSNDPRVIMAPNGPSAINHVQSSFYTRALNSSWGTFDAARIDVVATNVSPGTESSDMSFKTAVGGTIAERVVISGGNVGVGTSVPGTILDVAGAITSRPSGTGAGQTGQLIMRELAANGTNTATIRVPDILGANYVLTLPVDDGTAGQVLSTDGNGVLSWIAGGGTPAADSLNFTELADALVLDASTDISATGTNVFSVTNSGTGASFRVNDEAADTSPFVIDASGNVGIGTSAPSDLLDLRATDSSPAVNINNGDSTTSRRPGLRVTNYIGTAGSGHPESV